MVPSTFARHESVRSFGWLVLAVVAWAVIAVAGTAFPGSPAVVAVLAVPTWAALTAGTVALRLVSGRELFPWQPDGLYLLGSVITGFVVAYEVFVTGRSTTVFLWYVIGVAGGAAFVRSRTAHATRA